MARNKPADHSRTFRSAGASYAVDGNTDGALYLKVGHIDTCAFTEGNDRQPWWRVDLGRTYEIHSIVFFGVLDAWGKFTYIFKSKEVLM